MTRIRKRLRSEGKTERGIRRIDGLDNGDQEKSNLVGVRETATVEKERRGTLAYTHKRPMQLPVQLRSDIQAADVVNTLRKIGTP